MLQRISAPLPFLRLRPVLVAFPRVHQGKLVTIFEKALGEGLVQICITDDFVVSDKPTLNIIYLKQI